jgi:hypothetical protein
MFKTIVLSAVGTLATGCFSNRPVDLDRLRHLDGPAVVRIVPAGGGETFRASVSAGDAGPASIRYIPLRDAPGSWVVGFDGWPLTYTAAKTLRYRAGGPRAEMSAAEIDRMYIEEYNGWLTLLSLPLTLPPGILDLIIHTAVFGFEGVDTRFGDTYSRQPRDRPDTPTGSPPPTPPPPAPNP